MRVAHFTWKQEHMAVHALNHQLVEYSHITVALIPGFPFRISDFSPELRDKIRNRKPGIEATITVALCRHFCSNSGIYLHPQAFPDSSMQKQSIREGLGTRLKFI